MQQIILILGVASLAASAPYDLFIALPSENSPSIAQPSLLENVLIPRAPAQPSGLYETPFESSPQQVEYNNVLIPQKPERVNEIPSEQKQIENVLVPREPIVPSDLYEAPSDAPLEQVEYRKLDSKLPEDNNEIPSEQIRIDNVLIPRVPDVPSGLYEIPSEQVAYDTLVPQIPERVNEIPSEQIQIENILAPREPVEPSELYESPSNTPSQQVEPKNEIPAEAIQIQDVFIPREPVVPSGLYETPSEQVEYNEVLIPKGPKLNNEIPSEQKQIESVLVPKVPKQPVDLYAQTNNGRENAITFPGSSNPVADRNSAPSGLVDQEGQEDSFLLQVLEDEFQALSQIAQQPAPLSGLYETPSESFQNPSVLLPEDPQPQEQRENAVIVQTTTPSSRAETTTMMMMGMPYDFNYQVRDDDTNNNFARTETSDGKVMRGEYTVLLPDGRLQRVTYFDDGNGFNAEVTYENPSGINI